MSFEKEKERTIYVCEEIHDKNTKAEDGHYCQKTLTQNILH